MQVEFNLRLSPFDTPAIRAAFEHFLAKCQDEVALGNTETYASYQQTLRRLAKALDKAEQDAFDALEELETT